ncbi:MAG: COG4223 family protein [Janthinobacterium lividum]
MEPFDTARTETVRGGADTGSRLDRLRARGVRPDRPSAPGRPVIPWIACALLLAFALGLIANPWFERSVRSRLPGFAPTLSPTIADLSVLQARVAALEARPAPRPPALAAAVPVEAGNERLARVEERLAAVTGEQPATVARVDRIATDLATLTGRIEATGATTAATLATATATAERAQSMLVLSTVRRTLDAGQRLGPLEPALRRQFTARAPQQVEAVAALGAAPVTLADLRAGLERLRPALTGVAAVPTGSRGWWQGLTDSLSGIVVRAGRSDGTEARLDRAARALAGGNVAVAVAEIGALPAGQRAPAQGWLVAAQRYQAGMRGLGQLDALMFESLPPGPVATPPAPAA